MTETCWNGSRQKATIHLPVLLNWMQQLYNVKVCCSPLQLSKEQRPRERLFLDLVLCSKSKDGLYPWDWSVRFYNAECGHHCFHSIACFPAAFLSYNDLGMDEVELLRPDNKHRGFFSS